MNNSKRNVFNTTLLFGAVQAIQAVSVLSRGKFAALYLGIDGYGRFSFYLTIIVNLQLFLLLGINNGFSRNLSIYKEEGKSGRINFILNLFYRYLIVCFFVLIFILIAFIAISDSFVNYRIEFNEACLLFFAIYLNILLVASQSIGQGLQMKMGLIYSSLFNSTLTVISSFVFFRFFGESSILVAILTSSFSGIFVFLFMLKIVEFRKVDVNFRMFLAEIKPIFSYGLSTLFAAIIGVIVLLLINFFLIKEGEFNTLAFYQASITLTTSSIALIFNALSFNYLPQLTQLQNNVKGSNELINDYTELGILIAAPLLMTFFVFSSFFISVLFSDEFLVISDLVKLMSVGSFFQVAGYAMALIPFARGDSATILKYALIGGLMLLLSVIFGYLFFGIDGVGYFFIIDTILIFFGVYYFSKALYSVVFNSNVKVIFLVSCVFIFSTFIAEFFIGNRILVYVLYISLVLFSIFKLSLYLQLDFRKNISRLINRG
jgi:PST family polysaccharide transporter